MILFLIFFLLQTLSFSLYSMETASKSFFHDNGVCKVDTVNLKNTSVAMSYFFVNEQCKGKWQLNRTIDYQGESLRGCALFNGYNFRGHDVSTQLADNEKGLFPLMESDWDEKEWKEKIKNYNLKSFTRLSFQDTGSTTITMFLNPKKECLNIAHWGHPFGVLINGENGDIIHRTIMNDYSGKTDKLYGDNEYKRDYIRGFERIKAFGGQVRFPGGSQGHHVIDPDHEVFERRLEELPRQMIGVFISWNIYIHFAETNLHGKNSQSFHEQFFTKLAAILFGLKKMNPDSDLSQKLFKLLGAVGSLDEALVIIRENNMKKLNDAKNKFNENIVTTSLVVFKVEKSDLKIDGDPDFEKSAKNVSLKLDDEKPLILENATQTLVINKEQKTLSDQASVSAIDIDKIVKDTSAVWDKASSDDEPEKKVNNLKLNDENSPLGPFKKFLTGIKVFWNNYPKICCGIGAGLAVALLFKVLSMRGFFPQLI